MKLKAEIWRGPFDQITEVEEELRSSRFFTNRQPDQWKLSPMDVMIPEVDSHQEEIVSSASQLGSMLQAVHPEEKADGADERAPQGAANSAQKGDPAPSGQGPPRQVDQAVDSERNAPGSNYPLLRRQSSHYPVFDIIIEDENIPEATNKRGSSVPPERTDWKFTSAKGEEEGGIGFTFSKSKRLNPFDSANQLSAEKSLKDLSAINLALSQVASAGNLLDDKWFAAQIGYNEQEHQRGELKGSKLKEDRPREPSRRTTRSFLLQQTVKKEGMIRSIFKNLGESTKTRKIPQQDRVLGKGGANLSYPLGNGKKKVTWG